MQSANGGAIDTAATPVGAHRKPAVRGAHERLWGHSGVAARVAATVTGEGLYRQGRNAVLTSDLSFGVPQCPSAQPSEQIPSSQAACALLQTPDSMPGTIPEYQPPNQPEITPGQGNPTPEFQPPGRIAPPERPAEPQPGTTECVLVPPCSRHISPDSRDQQSPLGLVIRCLHAVVGWLMQS